MSDFYKLQIINKLDLTLVGSEQNETATLKPDYKIEKTDRKY